MLAEHTARFFAWTIDPPLTAAALGAAYWAAVGLELGAARAGSWAQARIAVPGVLTFTALVNIPIAQNWDGYDFSSPLVWAWVGVYACVPLIMGAILVHQRRQPGEDPPRGPALPVWIRGLLAGQTLVFLALGLRLLVMPESSADVWPWDLDPTPAYAAGEIVYGDADSGAMGSYVACWLLGLGVVAGQSVWENDLARLSGAFWTYAVLAVLQLIALARFAESFDFGGIAGPAYLLMTGSILAVGVGGALAARRVT